MEKKLEAMDELQAFLKEHKDLYVVAMMYDDVDHLFHVQLRTFQDQPISTFISPTLAGAFEQLKNHDSY